MHIGFIGAGNVTKTFWRDLNERWLSRSSYRSLRGPETLAALVADLGPGATAGTKAQAAESGSRHSRHTMVSRARGAKSISIGTGRILIDATNAHMDTDADN